VKVLVVNSALPFVRGGAEELADQLVSQLNAVPGVESELLRVPFKWTPAERLIDEILLNRSFRLFNVDRVIAIKFPAYLIPHPNKVLWLMHQYRQVYDLADAGQGLTNAPRDRELKEFVRNADNQAFAEFRRLYVNSPVTQARLKRYNGFDAEVLYAPVNEAHLFTGGESGDYIFCGGRVSPGKRQHMLIEAMARGDIGARLLIAGPPETDAYARELEALVERHDLADRVELRLGFHTREEIADWVNGALACAYLPFDEDSLGYVTMEAFTASKAVLTTTDSGGLLEIVGPDTGVVVEPRVEAVAAGLAELAGDRSRTLERGAAAGALWRARANTWPDAVARLLS
jgi:glycosyltransferase involved in cell wall biosynthesis